MREAFDLIYVLEHACPAQITAQAGGGRLRLSANDDMVRQRTGDAGQQLQLQVASPAKATAPTRKSRNALRLSGLLPQPRRPHPGSPLSDDDGLRSEGLRANGQTDGWLAHLASEAGTACLRSTSRSRLMSAPLTTRLHRAVRLCTTDATDELDVRVQSRVPLLALRGRVAWAHDRFSGKAPTRSCPARPCGPGFARRRLRLCAWLAGRRPYRRRVFPHHDLLRREGRRALWVVGRAIAFDGCPDWSRCFGLVMAGLVPAIHVLRAGTKQDVDARPKAGHDDRRERVLC